MFQIALLIAVCATSIAFGQERLEELSYTAPCSFCIPNKDRVSGQFGDGEKSLVGGRNDVVARKELEKNPWFPGGNQTMSGRLEYFYPGTRNKSWYTIQCPSPTPTNRQFGDPNSAAKTAAIRQAVKAMTDRQMDTTLLWGASFNCSNDRATISQVIKRANEYGVQFKPVQQFHIGPSLASPFRGSESSVAAKLARRADPRTIDILHMIGHILYERDQTAAYYDLSRRAETASRVSGYAQKNMNEFVAEVFAGMMIGHQWDREVLNEYNRAWVSGAR